MELYLWKVSTNIVLSYEKIYFLKLNGQSIDDSFLFLQEYVKKKKAFNVFFFNLLKSMRIALPHSHYINKNINNENLRI